MLRCQVRAGTGGEEAALWAADLIRMYQRYSDSQVGQSAATVYTQAMASFFYDLHVLQYMGLNEASAGVQSWKVSLLNESLAEAGGYKECVLQIKGDRQAMPMQKGYMCVCCNVFFRCKPPCSNKAGNDCIQAAGYTAS